MFPRYLAIKVVMMPRDTNPLGTIFGGVLLSYIDQAAHWGAKHAIDERKGKAPMLVTIAIDKVDFKEPVLVGDLVSFWSTCIRVGKTSVTVRIEVEAERKGNIIPVTQADVIYVSVDRQPDGTLKPGHMGFRPKASNFPSRQVELMTDQPPSKSSNPFSRLVAYFKGHPTGFYFFFWGELAERCSFYGMKVILIVYMTKTLGFKDEVATQWESYFTAAAFLAPLLGGWIADRYLGKYWTIVGFAIPYVIGNALMMFEGEYFLLAAMAIIALGSGVIKPNISSLMGMTYDQQRPGQDQLRSDAFTMFYWAINFGSLISKFFVPILRNKVGPNLAFLLPTALIAMALAVFALGKRHYAKDIPTNKQQFSPEEKRERWTVFFRLLGVFLLIIVFWSVFLQKDNVWVYFIRDHIDTTINGVEYKPDQFLFLNAFFILTLLPLASYLYKVLERRGIKLRPTDKMQLGFIFTALAPLVFILVEQLPGDKHSLFWVILAFFFLTMGEVLISPVGLELAFVAAPKSMKGFVTGCFLLTSFAGSTLNGMITPWYSKVEHGTKFVTPTMYFGFQVIALVVAMTAFYFVAIPFNRRLATETPPQVQ